MENRFSVGRHVRLSGFSSIFEILAGPNSKGEFEVCRGAIKMWVHPSKLSLCPAKKAGDSNKSLASNSNPPQASKRLLRLDLHGYTIEQAKEQLEVAIDKALRENIEQIEIIHGKGTGVLKEFVQKYLSEQKHISQFRPDDRNPGTTWAYI